MKEMPTYPFEASPTDIRALPEEYVAAIFSCLESEFLVMPKGKGYIEYAVFEDGYETLRRATQNFTVFAPGTVVPTVLEQPIVFIVLRTMLGFTPPEWAYVSTQESGTRVDQGFARGLDRGIRIDPHRALGKSPAQCGELRH